MRLKIFGKKTLEKSIDNKVDYKKILSEVKSDSEFIKTQYENYIYNSLKNDFDLFCSNLDENLKSNDMYLKTHWFIKEFNHSTVTLRKAMDEKTRYSNILTLYISYNYDKEQGDVTIKSISGYGDLNSKRMYEIVSDYIYSALICQAKTETYTIKKELEKVIKVVGRDTVRDVRINEIFG